MHKDMYRMDSFDISEEEYRELCKQPAVQMVVKAVTQHNELVSRSENFKSKEVNELLIKEAEEDDAKVFLDEIFNIVEKRK